MGTIPWNALVFLTLYFQLMGMSDFHASMLMSLFLGSVAFGGLLGGFIGDEAASRFPHHGRVAVTQFSSFIGIPLSWIIIKVNPDGRVHRPPSAPPPPPSPLPLPHLFSSLIGICCHGSSSRWGPRWRDCPPTPLCPHPHALPALFSIPIPVPLSTSFACC